MRGGWRRWLADADAGLEAFFFQAEDGIRDKLVTGVQTCALPISGERAYQQAMLFLSYRARSEAEIRQNLRKHEYPAPAIERTLERLRLDRLADDKQFAQAWVENRSTFRPRSRRALTMELRQKGLDDETVQIAVAGVDEEALAYEAARKRLGRLQDLELNEFRKKLSEFL